MKVLLAERNYNNCVIQEVFSYNSSINFGWLQNDDPKYLLNIVSLFIAKF